MACTVLQTAYLSVVWCSHRLVQVHTFVSEINAFCFCSSSFALSRILELSRTLLNSLAHLFVDLIVEWIDIFASIEAGSESSLACSLWRIQNDAAPKRIHSQNICALHSGGVANKYQVAVESSNGGVLCVLSPVERRAYSSVEPGHRPKGAFSNAVCSDVQLHILDVRHGRIEVRTRLLSGLTGSLNDLQRCSIFSTTSSVASSTETTGLMLRLSYIVRWRETNCDRATRRQTW